MEKERVRASAVEQAIREFEDAVRFRPMPLSRHKRMVEEQEATIRSAIEVGLVDEEEALIF